MTNEYETTITDVINNYKYRKRDLRDLINRIERIIEEEEEISEYIARNQKKHLGLYKNDELKENERDQMDKLRNEVSNLQYELKKYLEGKR